MTSPLDIARSEVGYVEQGGPDGHSGNITRYWDWWDSLTGQHDQGYSWCGAFVSYCFDHAGMRFTINGGPGFIYCPAGEVFFRNQGRLTDAAHAKPGDIAFFHFPGEANEANHTGIVESVDAAHQTITCIEGNTSSGMSGSQSNGGGVYRRTRSWMLVRSIGSVLYPKPPAAPPEENVQQVTLPATPDGVPIDVHAKAFDGSDIIVNVHRDDVISIVPTVLAAVAKNVGLDGKTYVHVSPACDVDVTYR